MKETYINKQQLIEYLDNMPIVSGMTGYAIKECIKFMIKENNFQLESIDVELKSKESGEWIKHRAGNGWNEWCNLQCNVCNSVFEKTDKLYSYCPNCGRKMKEGER